MAVHHILLGLLVLLMCRLTVADGLDDIQKYKQQISRLLTEMGGVNSTHRGDTTGEKAYVYFGFNLFIPAKHRLQLLNPVSPSLQTGIQKGR